MERFCVNCGTKFEAINNMARYCPACVALKKEEQKQKQKQYAKARIARLDLVNINIYKADKEKLKAEAEKKSLTVADYLKSLLNKPEPEKAPAVKAAKSTATKKKA